MRGRASLPLRISSFRKDLWNITPSPWSPDFGSWVFLPVSAKVSLSVARNITAQVTTGERKKFAVMVCTGVIHLESPATVCKKGDVLTPEQAKLLVSILMVGALLTLQIVTVLVHFLNGISEENESVRG